MPTGFQCFNQNGTIQIDSDWVNYGLVNRYTVSSSSIYFPTGNINGIQVALDNFSDLVFVSCAGQIAYHVSVKTGPSARTITYAVNGLGVPVDVYVYRGMQASATNSGMQIFGPDGRLIFDANSRFMNVSGSLPVLAFNTKYALPAGRKYAICFPSFYGRNIQEGFPNGAFWDLVRSHYKLYCICQSDGIQTTGEALITAYTSPWFDPSPPPASNVFYAGGSPLVIDVTGF